MSNKPKSLYMIRCSKTGMYSPGGSHAYKSGLAGRWNEKGKCWTSMGALKNHLHQMIYTDYGRYDNGRFPDKKEVCNIPPEWEIVSVEVTYTPVSGAKSALQLMGRKANVHPSTT